jgi:hypothetical protein
MDALPRTFLEFGIVLVDFPIAIGTLPGGNVAAVALGDFGR